MAGNLHLPASLDTFPDNNIVLRKGKKGKSELNLVSAENNSQDEKPAATALLQILAWIIYFGSNLHTKSDL